jgi:hypothetical protein
MPLEGDRACAMVLSFPDPLMLEGETHPTQGRQVLVSGPSLRLSSWRKCPKCFLLRVRHQVVDQLGLVLRPPNAYF